MCCPPYLTSVRLGIKTPPSPNNNISSPCFHHWSAPAGSDAHGATSYFWADEVWWLVLSTACSLTHHVLGDNGNVDNILQPIVNLLLSMLNLYYKHLPWMHESLCMQCFFLTVCRAGGTVLSHLPHAVMELFIWGNEATWRSQEDTNFRCFCLSSAHRVQPQGIWLHWQILKSAATLCWRRVKTCMSKRWQNQR